nr:hypothetical protein [Tanacetum cinerariifolium]
VPDVPEDEIPKKGFFFDNYNDAFEMYQLYSDKARFNIRKAGFKCKNSQITHNYIECNSRKTRRAKEVNTLNEDDEEDGEIPATKKRKRRNKSQAINCPAKLCLKKLLVLGDLAADTNFRKDFYKLVWNVYIGPEVFEQRWDDMITRYNLHENKWLSDMYAVRERWVRGYFKEVPMCGLMKITSRSESSNSFFQLYSHKGNTLVQFMLCFESKMEKKRYTQRVLDNASNGSTPSIFTELPIGKHECAVYTPSMFREIYGIDKIPDAYLNHHWTKNVMPAHLLDKRYRYGPCIEETDTLASQLDGHSAPPDEGDTAILPKCVESDLVVRLWWKGHNKATCKGCSACGEAGHHKGVCKRFSNQDNENEINDEDEGLTISPNSDLTLKA